MNIREATIEDALPIARIIVDYFSQVTPEMPPDEARQLREQEDESTARRWRRTIQAIAQGREPLSCVYVAEDAGEVVGMAYACPSKDETQPKEVGELDMLYIKRSHHRRGIGTALMKAAATHMAGLGISRLQLCTPTDHTQGRRFYDKLGGKIVGSRVDYDNGDVIPLVVYEWADIGELVRLDTGKNWGNLGITWMISL